MTQSEFEKIEKKYCQKSGSWAIWKDCANVSDLSVFDVSKNPDVLNQVKPNVVMVGLNASVPKEKITVAPYSNFHSNFSRQKDYKICCAFKDTNLWGAYMTDLIKNYSETNSTEVEAAIKNGKVDIQKCVNDLFAELDGIGAQKPLIICFGGDVFKYIKKYAPEGTYCDLVNIRHYAAWGSAEDYRSDCHKKLAKYIILL